MVKKSLFVLSFLVIALVLCAGSAQAATANFQGNCTGLACQFDAQRGGGSTCPGSTIWKYSWDYGDGNSSGLTGNSVVSHTYGSGGSYQVTLNVFCLDGNQAMAQRWVCFSFGAPGCILTNNGWN